MTDKLEMYKSGKGTLPENYDLWPLYGAGLENMGINGKPLRVALQTPGPDQLLVRHDACGLCFSDIKVIAQGSTHPRIQRDMQKEPAILGHEVSMTVLQVGENLKSRYKVGDRLTLETEVFVDGKPMAYGYVFQGGLSQYSVLDRRILENDHGDNLIKLKPEIGYAQSALTEPWACVIAAYRLEYRQGLKNGGLLWVIGAGEDRPYTISKGFDSGSHPSSVYLTNVPAGFDAWLRQQAAKLGVEVVDVPDVSAPPFEFVDDILMLGTDPDLIEKVSPHLAHFGVMALMAEKPMPRKVMVDVGRIHYHRWVYVGSSGLDVNAAYAEVPVRSNLKPGGKALFVGAGGPMGRMHVQRAIQFQNPPSVVVCSDVSDMRLEELCTAFASEAKNCGIQFICVNPMNKEAYTAAMAPFEQGGFDDVVVLAPVPAVISDSSQKLAPQGVMNVFAGVARGTLAAIDLSDAYLKQARVIGHSASAMDDMMTTISKTNTGELEPNRSVAAVGSLNAAVDGLRAVKDATLPGKAVIYPNIKDLPLTTLPELKEKMPSVYAKLTDGREWTNEAEEEFLRLMLP